MLLLLCSESKLRNACAFTPSYKLKTPNAPPFAVYAYCMSFPISVERSYCVHIERSDGVRKIKEKNLRCQNSVKKWKIMRYKREVYKCVLGSIFFLKPYWRHLSPYCLWKQICHNRQSASTRPPHTPASISSYSIGAWAFDCAARCHVVRVFPFVICLLTSLSLL